MNLLALRRWCLAVLLVAGVVANAAETLHVYVRPGCPRCADAKEFLTSFATERPDVVITLRDIALEPGALTELQELARANGISVVGVPAFAVRGRLMIGFDGSEEAKAAVRALVSAAPFASPPEAQAGEGVCVTAPTTCTEVPEATAAPESTEVRVPLLGLVSARELGLPLFTLVLGLLDGFNPCAMWVLLFLLSMLVNLRSRARMFAVGGTFVLVGGAVYLAFMAAWLNLFLLVQMTRAVQVVLGLIALTMAALQLKEGLGVAGGPSLSIPESAKPGIYARVRNILQAKNLGAAIASAAVLAALVNLVELLCTAGLPALYTHVLASSVTSPWAYAGYLLLYITAYILDDSTMLTIAVVTLSRRKLQEKSGNALKLISGTVMAALAALLLFQPEWLSF